MASGTRDVGVIDVGSNSVRLVVYRASDRALTPILNEKVLAGLGEGVAQTGRLPEAGRLMARKALRRFKLLLDGLGITDIEAVATAAMREAEDGPRFADEVYNDTGIRLRIISGVEEGRLSALGVMSSIGDAEGVVADLGGASMELVRLRADGPGSSETHLLGPLSLRGDQAFVFEAVEAYVRTQLERSRVLSLGRASSLYAVGGAWRAIARVDMQQQGYPLEVLHNYVLKAAEIPRLAQHVSRMTKKQLEKVDEAVVRRAESLPYAAVVLDSLVATGRFEQVVISSSGLREGVLYNRLAAGVQALDPLVAGAEAMAGFDPRTRTFGQALAGWLQPMFAQVPPTMTPEREATLLAAACRLADLGAGLHPDHRADIVYEQVLRGPYVGATHAERAFLALAVRCRYGRKVNGATSGVDNLLDDAQKRRAEAIGAAMRLGADFSGRAGNILTRTSLQIVAGGLALVMPQDLADLRTDQSDKRLQALADQLGISQSGVVITGK